VHARSNLVPGLTYDRFKGKNYLQACYGNTPFHYFDLWQLLDHHSEHWLLENEEDVILV